ncbi:uncharacterized protein LOC114276609 [Camellia sinensis]|uniref:uncharacterized protein LOC114276609 n=1 Tax=Camellia sinensis TaxID=4442 RepID=UPI0010369D98|nr:uncharacterized protein LOC114276609 [Camellia sinensis]
MNEKAGTGLIAAFAPQLPTTIEEEDRTKEITRGRGGSAKFICNFGCKLEAYTGSYSQVRAHLIGKLPGQRAQGIKLCPKVNKTEREWLKQEELDAQRMFLGNAKARKFPRSTSTSQVQSQTVRSSDMPHSVKVSIDNMFYIRNREEVDQTVSRCLYSNGIAFNVVRSPRWTDMVTAINNTPKGYKSPNYEKARTNLLDKEQSKEKNATNIADLLIKAIEFVGPSNVVQVVTDNATNCKAAGVIIQRKYSHIIWSGCLAHTLNLLMKDIAKCEDPALLFVDESYKRVRPALLSMALSKQWENLRKNTSSPHQHDIVHQTIMDDDFWRKAKTVLTITKHIYKMLRFSDSDKVVIEEVYELMDTMLGNIKDTLSNDPIVYDLIHQFVVERWNKMNIPLHCLAYILVPRYYTNSWLSKSTPGGVRRKKPHFDVEVQKGYLEAIEKMICDQTEVAIIRKQISDFVSCKGVFSQPQAVNDRATMDALSWWHLYGGAAPELYSLALKVLSQSVNTSCAERCWSTYSYIHNVKRNRLNVDRAEKLVFVHYNHRLLSRYREDYENFKNWDAHPEDANI